MKSTRPSSRVTANDVAKAAGVSQATVSLALRGSPEISRDRITQIRKLARQMSYHPRAAAQLLRSKRTGQIGVLVAARDAAVAFGHDFTGPMLGHLVNACVTQDLRYMIEFHHHAAPHSVPHQITSGLVDGSLLIGDVGDPLRRVLDDEYPDYPWVSIEEPSRYCVLADSRQGVSQAIRRLAALGHRRIAYMCGPQRYHTHREGLMGWQETMSQLGLPCSEAERFIFENEVNFDGEAGGSLTLKQIVEWVRQTLSRPQIPTAFMCHDMIGARAVVHVATEHGLRTPRDLSVISWGSRIPAQEQYPPLTTVELDYRVMVERGMELLNRRIERDPITESKVMVAPTLVEGATVGPLPMVISR